METLYSSEGLRKGKHNEHKKSIILAVTVMIPVFKEVNIMELSIFTVVVFFTTIILLTVVVSIVLGRKAHKTVKPTQMRILNSDPSADDVLQKYFKDFSVVEDKNSFF